MAATTIAGSHQSAHRVIPETRPPMLKADLKKLETADRRPEIGGALRRARKAIDWTLKDLQNAIEDATGKRPDEAQLQRWEAGSERPQFDVLRSACKYWGPLVICLAGLDQSIEVETTIRIRRIA